jgi:prolyl oligopeptidase
MLFFISPLLVIHAQLLQYPANKKTATIDNYFGTKVADPYRWLEDDNSDETRAWVMLY